MSLICCYHFISVRTYRAFAKLELSFNFKHFSIDFTDVNSRMKAHTHAALSNAVLTEDFAFIVRLARVDIMVRNVRQ